MSERKLNLSKLLEPLKHCPLTELDIGYNALEVIYPGLNMFAPKLQKLFVSNNLLIHMVTLGTFCDIMMHPSLFEVHFENQGFIFYIKSK